jgi:hypothetical protein
MSDEPKTRSAVSYQQRITALLLRSELPTERDGIITLSKPPALPPVKSSDRELSSACAAADPRRPSWIENHGACIQPRQED